MDGSLSIVLIRYYNTGTRNQSDDNGGTWADAVIVAAPFTKRVVGPMIVTDPQPAIGAASAGTWQSETSSLIYDPGAPAGWEYLGKLLTPADAAAAVGRDHYQAPAIVQKEGRSYLIATPVDTTVVNRYDGCRIYKSQVGLP